MGKPDIFTQKAQTAAPFQGAHPIAGLHKFVFALPQVGVQAAAGLLGQGNGGGEAVCGAVHGLAGGNDDLPHGEGACVMVFFDERAGVGDKGLGVLTDIVRNGAAIGHGTGVRCASGMIADADLLRRLHLPVDRRLAGAGIEAVLVIKGGGAAVLDQVCHGGQGGIVHDITVDIADSLEKDVQPFQDGHIRVVDGGQVADKGLEKVVVRIDKARVDQLTGGVDDLGTFAGDMRGDLKDLLAFDQKIAVFIDPVAFVAADNGPGVSEQCLSHHSSSLSAK